MRLRDRTSWLFATLVVAGCGASYYYAPEDATISVEGTPVAKFEVPPEEPRGEVRVESRGITKLDSATERQIPALQVRLTVGNDSSDTPWVVDTREQLLEVPGLGRSRPLFANADRESLPVIQIGRRDRRVIDLYYRLPPNIDDASDLSQFELLWQVNTGDRTVAQRTPFGRMELEPDPYYSTSLYAGWGPYWWYDPYYPGYSSFYSRPFVVQNPHVIVSQPRQITTIRDRR